MKKLIITVLALVAGITALAQEASDIDLSVGVGFIGATKTTTYNGSVDKCEGPGFYAKLGFCSMFGQSGAGYLFNIFYTSASYDTGTSTVPDSEWNESNVGFLMALCFRLDLSEQLSVMPYVGPGTTFGLKSVQTATAAGVTATIDWYDDDDPGKGGLNYQRQNAYLSVGLAADVVKKVRLSFGYDFGMWNRITNQKDTKLKDTAYRFGIAYIF